MNEEKIRASLSRIERSVGDMEAEIGDMIEWSTATAHSMAAEVHLGAFRAAMRKHVDHVAPEPVAESLPDEPESVEEVA